MDTSLVVGPLTVDDLPAEPWPRHELVEGALYVTPMGDARHQVVVMDLAFALRQHAKPGHTVTAGCNVVRGRDTVVIPDVVVALAEEMTGLGPPPEACVLFVEVLSPSTRLRDLTLKRALYESWGVSCWFVDPQTRVVTAVGDAYRDVPLPGFTFA